MNRKVTIQHLPTGVPGLDEVLGGGIPELSFNLIAGAPGSGKTTLAHQMMFSLVSPDCKALFFTVVGEPPLKMLRYQQQFPFFDVEQINQTIRYVNLADVLQKGDFSQVLGPQPGWEWQQNPDGSAAPRPGGPADPSYQYQTDFQSAKARVDAAPPEPIDPPGQSEVVAQVMLKAQQVGVEGLNDVERRIFDYATTRPASVDPLALLLGQGGAQPYGQPSGQTRQQSGGPARPQTQADFDRLPRGTRYIDPEDGQLYEKE